MFEVPLSGEVFFEALEVGLGQEPELMSHHRDAKNAEKYALNPVAPSARESHREAWWVPLTFVATVPSFQLVTSVSVRFKAAESRAKAHLSPQSREERKE